VSGNVYRTVERKRASEGPLAPAEAEARCQLGFRGWHTRGYLPHCDIPGALQMITFRLADSLPASRRAEWEPLTRIQDERLRRTKLEAYLDMGCGSCVLREPAAAKSVESVLHRFDGIGYRLAAWIVMPNHVHALVELWTIPMGKLLKAWKGASANAINRLQGRRGTVLQQDYWDRYVRDEAHFRSALRYLESNPLKAGLARAAAEWPFGSANPQWRWTGPDRYRGAQLVWEPERGPGRGHSCPPEPERGHSCPPGGVSERMPAYPPGVEHVFASPPKGVPQHYSSAGVPLPATKQADGAAP